MKTTSEQDKEFIAEMIAPVLLEMSIAWIVDRFSPAELFKEGELEDWAENNGYEKREKK